MTTPVYEMPCGCLLQYGKQTSAECLVVDLVQWCPTHRVLYVIVKQPEGWNTRQTGDAPSRAPAAKKAKPREEKPNAA